MLTTGIDLIEISRIEKSMENPRFLTRVFSVEELALLQERNFRAETVAASFAAKEALAKALGTGVRGFALREISVLRDSLGKPYFQFDGRAKELVEASGLSFSVSLTHTETTAAAFVIGFSDKFHAANTESSPDL